MYIWFLFVCSLICAPRRFTQGFSSCTCCIFCGPVCHAYLPYRPHHCVTTCLSVPRQLCVPIIWVGACSAAPRIGDTLMRCALPCQTHAPVMYTYIPALRWLKTTLTVPLHTSVPSYSNVPRWASRAHLSHCLCAPLCLSHRGAWISL